MAMRNFYLRGQSDGRKSEVTMGPQGKEGGMSFNLYQRDEGKSVPVLDVRCWEENGELITQINIPSNLRTIVTRR